MIRSPLTVNQEREMAIRVREDERLHAHVSALPAGLCARTVCTFLREFSSFRRERATRALRRGVHTVALSTGHVSQLTERLACRRVRPAASAGEATSAGIVSPVPNYISSGV
jgi:hypothetical protein